MQILNQPFQGQLGNVLIEKLNSNYNSLTIFSAFAKNSGVLRLKSALQQFRINEGSITAFIGIDLDGTSYEALLNLYSLCDKLYVIHSENPVTTYHSKIYLLENDTSAWCAIGSNNLTGGGLWTNFESCSIHEYNLISSNENLENISFIIDKYTNPSYVCSTQIKSTDDLDTLLNSNYISKEITQKIENINRRTVQKKRRQGSSLFGSEKVTIPTIISHGKNRHASFSKNPTSKLDLVIQPPHTPAFTHEQFWFEMRKSTGGSRNILDLSMLGKIESGSVVGTPYQYTNPTHMYGGVKFFEINPTETHIQKNITINYQGIDYYPSTIKFAPNNGSWRIQLKGFPNNGNKELSKYGNDGTFVHKILIFEKITSDYYVLSLVDENQLALIKTISRVWARNGNSVTSKSYGML